MYKTIALALLVSSNSYAMYCGNVLLEKGMPIYQVKEACHNWIEYNVGGFTDKVYLYITGGSQTTKLVFIDGLLYTIGEDR